jgi:hypothetical protein
MLSPILRCYRFARGDGSLTVSVVFLALFSFVLYPMVELNVIPRVWLDIAFALTLAFGAIFVFEPRPLVRWFLVFLSLALTFRVIEHFANYQMRWLTMLALVFAICACVSFATLLLTRVMRDGRMNLNRIMGAIGSYLLIGIVFQLAYKLLALNVPHAFAIGGVPVTFEQVDPRLSYYSFITLTSTGYGDITPLHPYARSLAVLEALSGGLYLTVLVARLVGLEMEWREERREERRHRLAHPEEPHREIHHPLDWRG